jgi:hypothetical protein
VESFEVEVFEDELEDDEQAAYSTSISMDLPRGSYAVGTLSESQAVPVVVGEDGDVHVLRQLQSCLSMYESDPIDLVSTPQQELQSAFEGLFEELLHFEDEDAELETSTSLRIRLNTMTREEPQLMQAAVCGAIQSYARKEARKSNLDEQAQTGVQTALKLRDRINTLTRPPLPQKAAPVPAVRPPIPPPRSPPPPQSHLKVGSRSRQKTQESVEDSSY